MSTALSGMRLYYELTPHDRRFMRRLRDAVERRRTEYLWGDPHRITPRLANSIFGNGRRLLVLEPTNTRPNYYVVRIDSRWQLSNRGKGELLLDHLDDIYDAIEQEFGRCESESDEGCAACKRNACYFPIADFGVGSSWGEMDWPKGFRQWKAAEAEGDQ